MKFPPPQIDPKSFFPGALLGSIILSAVLLSVFQREKAKREEVALLFRKIVQCVERDDFESAVRIAKAVQEIHFLIPYDQDHVHHAGTVIRGSTRIRQAAMAPFVPYVIPRRQNSSAP